jgi:hypothetical protein
MARVPATNLDRLTQILHWTVFAPAAHCPASLFEPAQFMHFKLCWRAVEYLSQANRWFITTANVFFHDDAGSPQSF